MQELGDIGTNDENKLLSLGQVPPSLPAGCAPHLAKCYFPQTPDRAPYPIPNPINGWYGWTFIHLHLYVGAYQFYLWLLGIALLWYTFKEAVVCPLFTDTWTMPAKSQVYDLGQTVNVQVSASHLPPGGQVYTRSCFATPYNGSKPPLQYTLIDNFGYVWGT